MPSAAPDTPALPVPEEPTTRIPGAERGNLGWIGAADVAVLANRILPLTVLSRVAGWHGRFLHRVHPRQAAAIQANLEPFAGPGERADRLARRFQEEQQIRLLLLLVAPRLTTDELRALLPIQGIERLEHVFAGGRGKGGLLLLSHVHSMGGLLVVILLRRLGFDVGVALPSTRDTWEATRARRFVTKLLGPEATIIESLGGFPCQFNVRPIVRKLQAGTIVAQTGDGWHSASFVDAPFLGRILPFPTGVMSIARLTGVPVIPLFAAGPASRMEFVVEEPFHVGRSDGDLEGAVRRYAARLDQQVRAWPAAWEHWAIPNTLDTLAGWRDRPLQERYAV